MEGVAGAEHGGAGTVDCLQALCAVALVRAHLNFTASAALPACPHKAMYASGS
jgi:hypothetical protein